MKKAGFGWFLAMFMAAALCLAATQARALEVISLSPGGGTVREIALYDPFDIRKLRPAELFVVLGSGSDEVPAGSLTVSVKPAAKKEFGAIVEFNIMGFSYPLNGMFAMVSQSSAAPLELKRSIALNSTFGFVFLAVYISDIQGDVERPVPFGVTFSLSVGE